jgi:hypothetical protein
MFYSLSQAREVIKTSGNTEFKKFSYPLRSVVIDLAQRLIQPNLTLNKNETEERKQAAANEVNEVFSQIKKGEMLLREGERVEPHHILKVEALRSDRSKGRLLSTIFGLILLFCVVLRVLVVTHLNREEETPGKNKELLFLAVMIAGIFILSKISVSLAEAISQGAGCGRRYDRLPLPWEASSGLFCACHGIFYGLSI